MPGREQYHRQEFVTEPGSIEIDSVQIKSKILTILIQSLKICHQRSVNIKLSNVSRIAE